MIGIISDDACHIKRRPEKDRAVPRLNTFAVLPPCHVHSNNIQGLNYTAVKEAPDRQWQLIPGYDTKTLVTSGCGEVKVFGHYPTRVCARNRCYAAHF